MIKFIKKTAIFVVPFFLVYALNIILYEKKLDGDLARVSYLYNNPSPNKNVYNKLIPLTKKYTLVSKLNFSSNNNFDVMSIGDSFSEGESFGYQNFLAHKNNNVLHFDGYLSGVNPIQRLIELINGGFFDVVKVNYVVLESVERMFVVRFENISFNKSISMDSIKNLIKNKKNSIPKKEINFFSNAIFKIPLTNIQYYYTNKPKYSLAYKVETNKNNLFSNNPDNLLFSDEDVISMKFNNDSLKIVAANNLLNKINTLLLKKNIKLIVLICPDKYDLYYNYILDKKKFEKPMFFNYYNQLKKEYIYIPSMEILSRELTKNKDVYFYGDTHWTPMSAKIIANEISKKVKF